MPNDTRIVFRFRDRFWEGKIKEPIGFLHASPRSDFPTWWSTMPLRLPFLTAWQGGLRSWQLSQLSEEERVQKALQTLGQILGIPVSAILPELQSWYTHDWNQDPFTLGAYSYIGVGGVEEARRLGSPFCGFLKGNGPRSHSFRLSSCSSDLGVKFPARDRSRRTSDRHLIFFDSAPHVLINGDSSHSF